MTIHRCDYCDCEVHDGDNGCVSELPPWADADATPIAMCWRCEGKLEAAAEERHVADQFMAAARAGRFDLL